MKKKMKKYQDKADQGPRPQSPMVGKNLPMGLVNMKAEHLPPM